MNLELRHFRLFVAVAELSSFSAAAREFEIAQPSVSRTIAVMEKRLGVQLVIRSTRSFALTPAGQTLLAEARAVLDAAAAAESRTRSAKDRNRITMAAKADSAARFLEQVIAACASDREPLEVDLCFREPQELAQAVATGEADVCLTSWSVPGRILASRTLWTEPRRAVVAGDHRLAGRAVTSLDDYLDEPVARWPGVPPDLDLYYQGLDGVAEPAPRTGPEVRGLAEALRLVELGRAVTFLPQSVADRVMRAGLAAVPVSDLSDSSMTIAWRGTHSREQVHRFVEVCASLASRGALVSEAG